MSKLLTKYETRIKNFVLKMSENPNIIKKYKRIYKPETSFQGGYPYSTSNYFFQKKAFSFKKYKSDKDRINEILQKNAILEEYYKKMDKEKEKMKKINQIKLTPKLIQPHMHFVNKNEDSIVNKKLAKKIKELTLKSKSVDKYDILGAKYHSEDNNLNKMESYDNLNKINQKEILTEEQIRQKNIHDKIISDRKNMVNTRKILMNLDEYKLDKKNSKYSLSEVYRKTEFKAMENLRMFKTSTMNKSILNQWKKEDQEKQLNIKLNNLFYLTEDNSNNALKNININFSPNKTPFENNNNPKMKKIYSMDNIELDINKERNYQKDNIDYNPNNFNIIKEKPYIAKRRLKMFGDKKILNNFNINKPIAESNPLLYELYFLNKKFKVNKIGISKEQFNQIKNLAFKAKENKEPHNIENDKIEEDLNNEENEGYNNNNVKKKLKIDQLADKILTETNWNLKLKYKSKYELLNNE